jgi:hypothetical protein
MQDKTNIVEFPADHLPFALLIDDVAVAQVPFMRILDACGEVMAELTFRNAWPGYRPTIGMRRLDPVKMKSLPAYIDARVCIESARLRSTA